MKNKLSILAALVIATLMTACPYDSKIPLQAVPSEALDPKLIGLWLTKESEDNETAEVRIAAHGDHEYLVEISAVNEKTQRFRAYPVQVGSQVFLNINELDSDEWNGSVFARYSFDPTGELSLRFVGDKAIPDAAATDSKRLVEFLAAHLNDPMLDDEDGPLVLRPAGS